MTANSPPAPVLDPALAATTPSHPNYTTSLLFWATKEAALSGDEAAGPVLVSRVSRRSLMLKPPTPGSVSPTHSSGLSPEPDNDLAALIQAGRPQTPREPSHEPKPDPAGDLTPTTRSAANSRELSTSSADDKMGSNSASERTGATDSSETLKLNLAVQLSSPINSRSSSDTSLAQTRAPTKPSEDKPSKTEDAPLDWTLRVSPIPRKRSSSSRGFSINRGHSESPTPVAGEDGADTPSGSFTSDRNASPSRRSSSVKAATHEISALRKDLERERTERSLLEAMVLEHQKLIEALSAKLERQSKIILSLQQNIEVFSRPQRIAATPPPKSAASKFTAGDSPTKKETPPSDTFSSPVPRKSKSARVLTPSIVSSPSRTPNPSLPNEDATTSDSRHSPTPSSGHVESPSPLPDDIAAAKKAKRKSKSSRELQLSSVESSPTLSRRGLTSESSSPIPEAKSKDKDSNKEKDKESSKDKPKDKDKEFNKEKDAKDKLNDKEKDKDSEAKEREREAKEKEEEKREKKERRKASRRSIAILDFSTSGSERASPSVGETSLRHATTETIISPTLESKRERRKSLRRHEVMSDITIPSASSSKTESSGIQFDTNPAIIPDNGSTSAGSGKVSKVKRTKMGSEKRHSTMRNGDIDGKKDALTDVEDFVAASKRRKVRRTLSNPDLPGESSSSTGLSGAHSEVDIVSPVIKKKSKRKTDKVMKSERSSPVVDRVERRRSKRIDSDDLSAALKSGGGSSSAPTVSPSNMSTASSTPNSEKRKSVRVVEVSRAETDSLSDSFETLAPAPHAFVPEAPKNSPSHRLSSHFKSTTKKEVAEEKEHNARRRIASEITSPRGVLRDVSDEQDMSNLDSSGGAVGTSNQDSLDLSASGHHRSPQPGMQLNLTKLSDTSNSRIGASSSEIASFDTSPTAAAAPLHYKHHPRTFFEQERDSREANILSPRGRELSGLGSSSVISPTPPSTARSHNFLAAFPANEIGIPILLEQICKYLSTEGLGSVALFEKRVDHARLDALRRKLEQTSVSCISSPKNLAANLAKDIKGEDPYVVAGVLKKWFMDLPDTLLMNSKSRYWLDVVEITDEEMCISGLQTLYYSLDLNRRRVLRFVIDFFKGLIAHSNGLTTLDDVCLRCGPLLLRTGNTPTQTTSSRGDTTPRSLGASTSTLPSSPPDDSAINPHASPSNQALSNSASSLLNTSGASLASPVSSSAKISRRGSARLDMPDVSESTLLVANLMRHLITKDSEIIKNHDEGIEFARRPDLQYVVRRANAAKLQLLLIDQNYTEREFSQVVWDTGVYYIKPLELLERFVAMYDRVRGDLKWQHSARIRILMSLKTWLRHSSFYLGPNKAFRSKLQQFSSKLMQELAGTGDTAETRILHSIMNASVFERSDDTWIQWKLQRLNTCEPFTFDLLRHEPQVVAGQLAMIHCRLLSMIHPSELVDNATLDPERSPNYTGVVQHVNCLTSWVAYDVLSKTNAADRVRVLSFYLDLADQLLGIGDFFGCWAIRGALDLHPVSRLSQTWEKLSRKDASKNKKLTAFFDPRMNFAEYRKAFDHHLNEYSFAIPILAFLPKDIIRQETSDPTFPEPNMVDVDKLRSIFFVLQQLAYANFEALQTLRPTLKPIQTIWDFFANLPVIQESTLDQLSYVAEPRIHVQGNRRASTNLAALKSSEH